MKYISSFLFLFLNLQASLAFYGKFPIQNFSPSTYKAGNQNIDFAQNRNMTLFVANNLGVLSYNGNNWGNHLFNTGKKKRSLAFDENSNRLYVGLQSDFGYFQDDWEYISLLERIPPELRNFDEVWDVFCLNSKVFFFTSQKIFSLENDNLIVLNHHSGFNKSFLSKGKLFSQTKDGKLFQIKGQNLIPTNIDIDPKEIISGLVEDNGNFLIFFNSGKIEYYSVAGNTEIKYKKLIDQLSGSYVNHILELSDTRIAIATQTAGVILFDKQRNEITKISTNEGLLSNACLRTFQDYTGNLWVGMQNGIALIHINSPMRLINKEINLQGSGYETFETSDGTYYSTSNGIFYREKNATKSKFLNNTEGPAYSIHEIEGNIYAGHHNGLFLLDRDKAILVARIHGLWQLKRLVSNPQYVIAGTYSGLHLFKINENKRLEHLRKIKGFNESSRFFEEDNQGKIFVGQYYKGLYLLELNKELTQVKVIKISDNSDLPIKDQILMTKIDEEIFLGTRRGIYRIDQEKNSVQKDETLSKVIGEQPVYLLKQDKNKNIHIVTDKLVGFFKQISLKNYAFIPSSVYQLRYHFNNDLLNMSVNQKNGVMFASSEGFIHYDPSLERQITYESPIVVSKVLSTTLDSVLYQKKPFGKNPEDINELVLQEQDKVVQFNVESFQFNEIQGQTFRYFLDGFDDKFSNWSNSPIKEYSNLKARDYQFNVQTINYLGEITSGLPLKIVVKPPIYQSLAAKVLYLILALSLLYLMFLRQKKSYHRKTESLEKKKDEEWSSKQELLQQQKDKKEKEVVELKQDKLQNELRHTNNLLAASTMNLVVKNEFIENIKGDIQNLKNKDKREIIKTLSKIEKEINTTLKLQEDWEQFEHHFDRVHGDFLSRLRTEFKELSPNDQKLCAFLRLNLSTKEIAKLMSISIRGVEVARYRLRKKLDLDKGQNLSKFILKY